MQKTFDHHLNMIKWIGIITMLVDHVGYFLFPQLLWLRIIGRVAFPCFLYGIIKGTERTRNYQKYIIRLILLGIISMPITPNTLNVVFLLAVFSLSLRYQKYFLIFLLLSIPLEYSVYGFLFGWAIYWMIERNREIGVLGTLLVQFVMGLSIQTFSAVAVPLLFTKWTIKLPRLPRYFFYWFYPVHQAVLILLVM